MSFPKPLRLHGCGRGQCDDFGVEPVSDEGLGDSREDASATAFRFRELLMALPWSQGAELARAFLRDKNLPHGRTKPTTELFIYFIVLL